jgi:protein gp37
MASRQLTPKFKGLASGGRWNGNYSFHHKTLDQVFKWKKPRLIFVCSMGDLFYAKEIHISRVFDAMRYADWHTYLCLTKRPLSALKYEATNGWPGDHVWLGVSVENQEQADIRIPQLLTIPVKHRFVSIEPLLGPVEIRDLDPLDWVIAGPETGPGARPCHPDWLRSLRAQCETAGVPFLLKAAAGMLDGKLDLNFPEDL